MIYNENRAQSAKSAELSNTADSGGDRISACRAGSKTGRSRRYLWFLTRHRSGTEVQQLHVRAAQRPHPLLNLQGGRKRLSVIHDLTAQPLRRTRAFRLGVWLVRSQDRATPSELPLCPANARQAPCRVGALRFQSFGNVNPISNMHT